MTEQEYETAAPALATAVWEISTGNGRALASSEWDSHMENCHAAVANTYVDGIAIDAWQAAALATVQGANS
jgi:hypothetical protein